MRLHRRRLRVALRETFVSFTGVVDAVEQQVAELTWEGTTGRGTARGVEPADLDRCAPALVGADPRDPDLVPAVVDRLLAEGRHPATVCAVDLALHDLLGRLAGVPLARLWGVPEAPLPVTARSIGAGSDDALRREAAALADWPVLKLKLTPDDDGSRAGVLRSVYAGRIRVDANGSWTPDQALRVTEELHRHDVELVEQPVPPGRLDDLAAVHARSPVPVWADEDVAGPDDVAPLAGRVAGVNVKLVKAGGLLRTRRTIEQARAHGLAVMVGCKLESALGVTAMAQLAGLADLADLDGHLLLADDPFVGLAVDRGRLGLPDTPGTGATLRPERADWAAPAAEPVGGTR